jgi:hypothetical protein
MSDAVLLGRPVLDLTGRGRDVAGNIRILAQGERAL